MIETKTLLSPVSETPSTREEYHSPKDYARIYEVKDENFKNENEIRIYKSCPEKFTFQIRTYKPITEDRKATSRNMIATVSISLEEMEQILEYMIKNN